MNTTTPRIPGRSGLIGRLGRPKLPDGSAGAGVPGDFAGGTAVPAWSKQRTGRMR